jgi:RNA polymerase sigma-70 factor, ECF subfamily
MDRDAILGTLRQRILAFATTRLAKDRAEDLTQDVLLILQHKYPHIEHITDLIPLSFQILRLKMMEAHRKAGRRGEYHLAPLEEVALADPAENPEERVARQQRLDRLLAALARLGDRCRELFRLKLEGLSFPEIQRTMGEASINTIYTWDRRCREQLLRFMGGTWD